jgi:probable phosphoglycerate mutase
MRLRPLYVLRHGQTEWNRAGRMQGWADSPLTGEGRAQAVHQGLILQQLRVGDAALRVSPLGRAMATAKLALPDRPEADFVADARLKEIDVGDWQGRTRPEMVAERPELFAGTKMLDWYDHAPGGEGFAGLEARCRAFLADLTGPTVVVTHGITSRMLRALALGLVPPDIEAVPGGQGVVHVVEDGRAQVFE